jgi:hypothetical protein
MTRRRRHGPSAADDAEDTDSPRGYRHAAPEPLAAIPPEGEILEPTPGDLRALANLRAEARNRWIGMSVGAALMSRFVAPVAENLVPGFGLVIYALVFALIGYALWTRIVPRGLGPSIVRVEPADEIVAGRFLAITLLIQPRHDLELDRVTVRLVARRSSSGDRDRGEIIASSDGVLAAGHTIEAEQVARLQTTLLVPEDAPPTSRKRGITWRVEVSFGEPPVFTHRETIRVLPLPERLRARAERRRRADPG